MREVKEWGPLVMLNGEFGSEGGQFKGCSTLTISASDAPDMSQCTVATSMFQGTDVGTYDFSAWNWSNITYFASAFKNSTFDGTLGNPPDLSSADRMQSMFLDSSFTGANSNIGQWDVSGIGNTEAGQLGFSDMFESTDFDQDISGWDITGLSDPTAGGNSSALTDFMRYGGVYSTANYDALLIGWSNLADNNSSSFPNNCTIHVNGSYTAGGSAETARNNLINNYGWTINDNGTA
jgi:hypothetical protein